MVFPGFNEASGTSTRSYPHEPTASKPCRPRGGSTNILVIGQGELDMERRAAPLLALRPDPPAVLGDDALADRQADARPLEAIHRVQAVEGAEDPARLLAREPDAVVGDRQVRPAVAGAAGDLHDRRVAVGELDGVGEEVLDQLAQPARVALDGGKV